MNIALPANVVTRLSSVSAHPVGRPVLSLLVGAVFSTVFLCAPTGGFAAIATFVALFALTIVVGMQLAEPRDLVTVLLTLLGMLVVRSAIAACADIWAIGNGAPFIAPDEGSYFKAASEYARAWHGEPVTFTYPSTLGGAFAWVAGGIFWLTGPNALVVKLLNVWLSVLVGLLAYRTVVNLGLPGRWWAFLIALLFPSFVAFSMLFLKDTYVVTCAAAVMWAQSEFARGRHWRWQWMTMALLASVETIRSYVFVIVSIAWVMSAAPHERSRRAASSWVGVVAMAAFLFVALRPFDHLGDNVFDTAIRARGNIPPTGRTNFVTSAPIARGEPGDSFVVEIPSSTQIPGTTPRVFVVAPGTEIVPSSASNARPLPSNAVEVRTGDIVVIATPTPSVASPAPGISPPPATPARTQQVVPIVVDSSQRSVLGTAERRSLIDSIVVNLRQVPIGLAYVLGAPFPWQSETMSDYLAIPEMLLWYVLLMASAAGVLMAIRELNWSLVFTAAAFAGTALGLSLIESNVGTIVRHRSMLLPYVSVLAAPGLVAIIRWLLVRVALPRRVAFLLVRLSTG